MLRKPVRGSDLRAAMAELQRQDAANPATIAAEPIPDELRERYTRFVADETRAIAAAYAALSGPKLMHHLHKLAGTASVYGDRELARAAQGCESRLRQGEPLAWLKQDLTVLFESAGAPERFAL